MGISQMRVLSLCAGLGGLCEAFVRSGDEVLRVDNNPLLSEVECMSIQDIKAMSERLHVYHAQGQPIREYDVLMAGIPCHEFSLAFSAPQAIASRAGEFDDYEPNMELLECVLDIIRITKPRYWLIENVMGSIRHFAKYGLEPRLIVGSHVLYGNFPLFDNNIPMPTKAERDKGPNPLRANIRAKVPIALSVAIRKAIIEQKTLFDDYNNP
jgi:hypothetical protein